VDETNSNAFPTALDTVGLATTLEEFLVMFGDFIAVHCQQC
jgi:hypothetical protein